MTNNKLIAIMRSPRLMEDNGRHFLIKITTVEEAKKVDCRTER